MVLSLPKLLENLFFMVFLAKGFLFSLGFVSADKKDPVFELLDKRTSRLGSLLRLLAVSLEFFLEKDFKGESSDL